MPTHFILPFALNFPSATFLQDSLGVKKAFALGSSQGGAIVTQMALLAPEKIAGLVDVGCVIKVQKLTAAIHQSHWPR